MTGRKDAARPSAEALGRILEVTRRLARPFDLVTLLTEVIDAGRSVLDADRGSVFLYDAAANELHTTVATGAGTLRIPANRGIVGECAQTRRVVNVPDCYADPRFNPDVDRETGYRTRCLLAVPLLGYDDSLVGVLEVLNKRRGIFGEEDESIATVLAAQCAVALERVRMLQEHVEKEKMERELAVARDIQMRVLPTRFPPPPGYDIAGTSRPADQTGGDIFDVIGLDASRLILLLGDATGHGIGPALSVTQVRAMLRVALRLGAGLDQVFVNINDQLCDDLPGNRFVTAFLGVLDAAEHRIAYHSGGQAPILHYHAGRKACDFLGASTAPMGMFAAAPLAPACTLDLAPGDIVGLITDGVYECASPSGEEFGTERVAAIVRENVGLPMGRLMETLLAAADRHVSGGPQADDMTLVLVRRTA